MGRHGTQARPELTTSLHEARLGRRRLIRNGMLLGLAAPVFGVPAATQAQESTSEGNPRHYGFDIEPAASEGGQMISAVGSVLRNWSLATGGWTGMSEALVEIDPNTFQPTGQLAESWEASDDAVTWTFHLRDGVTWHDGEAFDADDVKFSYELHAHPDNVAAATVDTAEFSQQVDTIEILDPLTVRMTLKIPVVDFPLSASYITIMAEHVLGDVNPAELISHPASTGADPSVVVFTGPFKFQEYVQNEQMTLVRNDEYWDGRPHLDEWIIKEVADPASQIVQLQAGELDFVQAIDPSSAAEFEGTDVQIIGVPQTYFNQYYYQLDPEKSPFFEDKRVRHALLYAIDREQLIEAVYFGFGEVAVGLMPAQSWAANEDAITARYPFDPEQAMALLDEAGWVDTDGDGVREKDGVKLQPTMLSVTDFNPLWAALPAVIQEFWRNVGVEMIPDVYSRDVYEEKITVAKDFDTAIRNGGPGITVDFQFDYRCQPTPSTGNRGGYCNERVDELITQAIPGELDQDRRKELITELQNIILDELPIAPLVRITEPSAVNMRMHNIIPNVVGVGFNAETWWVDQ